MVQSSLMHVAFIIVGTENSAQDVKRLKKELTIYQSQGAKIYVVRNKVGVEGYAKGVNKGIRRGLKEGVDIFYALNPDIKLPKATLSKLVEPSSRFDVWGYRMIQQGSIYDGGIIDKKRLSGGLQKARTKKRYIKTEFVSGSCMAFTKEVVKKVGQWDESYGMYYEDVEFCTRARMKGFRVGIDTTATYDHYERSQLSAQKELQLAKSRARYFVTHANIVQYIYECMRIPKTIYEYRSLISRSVTARPFLYNFLSLNSSSFINKVLNFILFLILVRYLSLHDYGIYNIVWVHIGLLMPLADFGTTSYGLIHENIHKKNIFESFFWLRLLLAFFFGVITILLGYILRFNSELMSLVYLCIPVMFSNALSGSLLIRTSSLNKTYIASIVSVVFNFLLIAALIVSLVFYKNITFLFSIVSLGYSIYALINFVILIRLNSFSSFSYLRTSVKRWGLVLKGSSLFVLLSFFAGLYFKADIYLIRYFKGDSAVGTYSAGYKFLEALLFIGSSYTVASAPILKDFVKKKTTDFVQKLRRDSLILFILSLVFVILMSTAGNPLMQILLRKNFIESIQVFRVVIFALPFLLVSTVYMSALYLLHKVYWVTFLFIFQILINVVLNYLYIPHFSYMASAYITVLSEIFNALVVLILFKKAYEHRT